MNEILKNVIEKCSSIAQSLNLSKIVWDMPYITRGCYVKGINQNNEETGFNVTNVERNIVDSFFIYANEIEPKINKGTLTIYSNGEYESSFIWDEETHLDYLASIVRSWFVGSALEVSYRVEDRCSMLSIDWDFETKVVISFINNISNPILFITENNPEMTFSLYWEQVRFYIENDYLEEFKEYSKVRRMDNDWVIIDTANYLMMNEGKLKGRYPRWNVASFVVKPSSNISFEDIKFEWREDLA